MIKGIGLDIIEISRVDQALLKGNFKNRVFTSNEISYCEGRGKNYKSSFAGIYAAKEALVKAFGTGFIGGSWQEIEIRKTEMGQPYIILYGYWLKMMKDREVKNIFLSISHSKDNAVAEVILEG